MAIKESRSSKVFNVFNICIMLGLIAVTLYPMLYVVFASVSDPVRLMAHEGLLVKPLGFTFAAYKAVVENPAVISGYANTLFVVVVGVIINIIMTSLGAYGLSRKNLKWKNPIMFFISFTMFFSGGLIPFYFTVKQLGLDNTLWALIIPSAMSVFNLIILRTAFAAVPESLEESAKLDGAGHFTILLRIIIPLTLPTLAVMVLYYGVGHWNSWFNAMIFIRKRELFPLQVILREILINNSTDAMTQYSDTGATDSISETIKYAIIIVATVPILALYPFLQKYFTKGVMIGAVKG